MGKQTKKTPGWRDQCVALLEQFIAREERIARCSYTEHRGTKRYFNQVIWRRADPEAFALVRKARALIEWARTLRIEIRRLP